MTQVILTDNGSASCSTTKDAVAAMLITPALVAPYTVVPGMPRCALIDALSTMADSLPGLGIVAAVLGVVITMGALGGPPEEIGHKVAAALVGTFLGILLCYGLVGPLAANMAKASEEEHAFYQVLRVTMTAFMKGIPPILAVEIGRRAVPGHLRPAFQELEKTCRSGGAPPQATDTPAAETPAADAPAAADSASAG